MAAPRLASRFRRRPDETNGHRAMVTFPDGVSMSSAAAYPPIAEAMTSAALKPLDTIDRQEALDRTEATSGD